MLVNKPEHQPSATFRSTWVDYEDTEQDEIKSRK